MLSATVSWSRDDEAAGYLQRAIPSSFPTTAPYDIPTRWVRERTRATSLSWLWDSTGINLASGKTLFASLSDSSFSVVSTAIFIPAVLRREGPKRGWTDRSLTPLSRVNSSSLGRLSRLTEEISLRVAPPES